MTVEGRERLHPRPDQDVAVINPDGGGSRAGTAVGTGNTDNSAGPLGSSEEEPDRAAACEFGETLCQKTANDWATAQQNDHATNLVRTCIENDIPSSDITE